MNYLGKVDFTQSTYKSLLHSLKTKFTDFYSFLDYIENSKTTSIIQSIILRHDVDRLPQNSLKIAQIEHSFGLKGTYFFRAVPECYDLEIMHEIANLGHEIGYHYEDVDLALTKNKELRTQNKESIIDAAYASFCKNLDTFRQHFTISTICMHGSPRSKYDNRLLWQKYNYKALGIIGEPYFDIDFNEFAYFTDTGRRWNGHKYIIRDKVDSKYNFDIKSTQQIIDNIDRLPDKVMFTIHPERWHANTVLWTKELIFQNFKNIVKRLVVLQNAKL